MAQGLNAPNIPTDLDPNNPFVTMMCYFGQMDQRGNQEVLVPMSRWRYRSLLANLEPDAFVSLVVSGRKDHCL